MKKFCFSLCIALTLFCCNAMAKSLIGAYRVNAACAEFSRHLGKLLYNCGTFYVQLNVGGKVSTFIEFK